ELAHALVQAEERLRLWAGLRRREAELAEAQRMARIGSWRWDIAAGRMSCSDNLLELFGITAARLADGLPGLLNLVHSDDRDRLAGLVRWAIAERRDFTWEGLVVRPDGETRAVAAHGSVVAGPGGEVVAVHGAAQDVSERRRAEDALRNRVA